MDRLRTFFLFGLGWRRGLSLALAALACLISVRGTQDANANGETRTLEFIHAHTRETIRATFRRDGSYDGDTLRKLNWFLRDWRQDEQTSMSPRLFDIIWHVYREVGANEPIRVMSAYRSPQTNNALRRRSRAVAKESQHIQGNAMDIHIPGVSMAKVRELAMRLQRGGVGYYPSAGSPFVHVDVGTVRSWPRMSREQLERLFPDGKTVHLPRDGTPLPGYEVALAEVKARGDSALDFDTITRNRGGSLWALLFGGSGDDAGDDVDSPMRPTRSAARGGPQRGRNAPVEVASLPANGDDVMRGGVVPIQPAPARRPPPAEQVLRPQPGSEPELPATPAPAPTPAQAAAPQPVLVASLPMPPIRPRGLAAVTDANIAVNEPLPPIRPPGLQERAAVAALAAEAAQPQTPAEPAPRLASGMPLPPSRPAAVVAAPSAATPVAVANAPQPPVLREVLAGARNAPVLDSSTLTQGFVAAPLPPARPATPQVAAKPERPIATRSTVDPAARRDMKAAVAAQHTAEQRPAYVVNAREPRVEREVKSGIVAGTFGPAANVAPQRGFTGGFIRAITPSFTRAGE